MHQLLHSHHHLGIGLDHRLHLRHQHENHLGQGNHRISLMETHLDNRLSDVHTPHETHADSQEVVPNRRQVDHDGRIVMPEPCMNSLHTMSNTDGEDRPESHLREIETHLNKCDNQVNNIDNTISEMSGRIQNTDNQGRGLDTRVSDHESQISNIENQIGGNENHINAMENHPRQDGSACGNETQVLNQNSHIQSSENQGRNLEPRIHENSHSVVDVHIVQERRLNSLEVRVGSHGNLAGLDNRLRQDINLNVEKRIANRDGHRNILDSRLSGLENCINGIDSRIESRPSHISILESRILLHENHLVEERLASSDNQSNVDPNENHINGLETRLNGRESHLGHHDSRIPAHGLAGGIDTRESILNIRANHIGSHIGHMGSHEHLQSHPLIQGLHHPHHPHPHHLHHSHHGRPGHSHSHMKCDSLDDPYSFVEDESTSLTGASHIVPQPRPSPIVLHSTPKKRGRKKKIKAEEGLVQHRILYYTYFLTNFQSLNSH